MRHHRCFPAIALARAAAALAAAASMPALAGLVTVGDVFPSPVTPVVTGAMSIGNTGVGAVTVNAGSTLSTDQLYLGGGATGDGTLTVTGAGSRATVTWAGGGNLDLGGAGRGRILVDSGGALVYGDGSAGCQLNCRIFVSNAAGSTGTVAIDGVGSSLSTVGQVVIGNASMFTVAADGFAYGTPGGASTASASVTGGATASSSFLSIGQAGGGLARTTETSTGTMIVDGIGSAWNIVRNAAQAGGWALLRLGAGINAEGTLTVRHGGNVAINGATSSGEFGGINIASLAAGSTATGARGTVNVEGPGSSVTVDGGVGFLNAGRGNGAFGKLSITGGGHVGATDPAAERGLTSANFGLGGGSGELAITGAGSMLRLSGRNSATNSDPTAGAAGYGAFLHVGRTIGTAAGTGSALISGGGRLSIDNAALDIVPSNGQTGFMVGRGIGSTGSMTITGAGSLFDVVTGNGGSSYTAVGRDGGTGTMTVSAGGKVSIASGGVSTPNPGALVYLPADLTLLEIGRTVGAATSTTGTVNVMGAGSEIVLSGTRDHLIQVGRGDGGNGTLNITAGGRVATYAVLVGTETGAIGTLNMNNGRLDLGGVAAGGPSPGNGGGLGVGRVGGVGMANIGGGSVVSMSSSTGPSLSIGGTPTGIGGTGIVNVTGGSSILIDGPNAVAGIGRTSSAGVAGIGTLNLIGAGSNLTVTGANASIVLGASTNSVGTAVVGAGASMSATSLIGVAHDGSVGSTGSGGIGTLVVKGNASASQVIVGSGGVLSGIGKVTGSVINYGIIAPGESPGRLTIDGGLDNRGGKIVLEVERLAGGGYAVDELVFTDPTAIMFGDGDIEFAFLDGTDPTAFRSDGLFRIDTFFKRMDASGAIVDLGLPDLFADVDFSASATDFVIAGFAFSTAGGATFTASAVPLPPSLALALLALAALGAQRRRVPVAA